MKANPYPLGLLAVLLAAALPLQVLAQAPLPVTGVITGASDGLPLPYATAVAYAPDSTIAASASTSLDGDFTLELPAGEYRFSFQYLGYDNLELPLQRVDAAVDLGELGLTEAGIALEGVEVVAERSEMVMKLDKRVFNVGKDLTGVGNTAADILDNVPSVNVDPEGAITLRGSGGVRILIDGKPSALVAGGDAEALRRLQGDIIESVEVITNPNARYEARRRLG